MKIPVRNLECDKMKEILKCKSIKKSKYVLKWNKSLFLMWYIVICFEIFLKRTYKFVGEI